MIEKIKIIDITIYFINSILFKLCILIYNYFNVSEGKQNSVKINFFHG